MSFSPSFTRLKIQGMRLSSFGENYCSTIITWNFYLVDIGYIPCMNTNPWPSEISTPRVIVHHFFTIIYISQNHSKMTKASWSTLRIYHPSSIVHYMFTIILFTFRWIHPITLSKPDFISIDLGFPLHWPKVLCM